MDVSAELRAARLRSGMSQRELATRSGTSQATVSAYESGRKQPTVATLARMLDAAGARLTVVPPRRTRAELVRAGDHLIDVLTLAEALPFRRPGLLRYPRLPT